MPDIVVTYCRDEVDVIETFIDFYLEIGFDHIYIVDNGSTDGTLDVIQHLIACAKPVTLRVDKRRGYEKYLTEHYHNAGRNLNARWLFFLDCDEFILFDRGVKSYLNSLDEGVSRLRIKQREMYPEVNRVAWKGSFLLSTKTELRMDDTTKDVTRYHPLAKVFAGKHLIDFPTAITFEPDNVFIRHYKYRTIQQASTKEMNRRWAHSSYSDEELESISAFGVARSREWIEACRRANIGREWMNRFDNSLAHANDHELADWAREHLLGTVG
jgi:glycosyltransferase involved in cell wall biosynthesis